MAKNCSGDKDNKNSKRYLKAGGSITLINCSNLSAEGDGMKIKSCKEGIEVLKSRDELDMTDSEADAVEAYEKINIENSKIRILKCVDPTRVKIINSTIDRLIFQNKKNNNLLFIDKILETQKSVLKKIEFREEDAH